MAVEETEGSGVRISPSPFAEVTKGKKLMLKTSEETEAYHTYLENRILKNYDKSFKRNIKDIRGASKDAKPSQDGNTKPTRGATLCTFDGVRTRGGNQLVKLIRAQGGCLGTKSR